MNFLFDEEELRRFVFWLPGLRGDEAYVAGVVVVRRVGGVPVDEVLFLEPVFYEGAVVAGDEVFGGRELWRLELYDAVRRLAAASAAAPWRILRDAESLEPLLLGRFVKVSEAPAEALGLVIGVNPGRVPEALMEVLGGFTGELLDALRRGEKTVVLDNPRETINHGLLKWRRTRFTVVYVGAEHADWVAEQFQETLGYLPARVVAGDETFYMVDIEYIRRRELQDKWFGRQPGTLAYLTARCSEECSSDLMEEFVKLLRDPRIPLLNRLGSARLVLDNIDVLERELVPIPGTLYRGVPAHFKEREV